MIWARNLAILLGLMQLCPGALSAEQPMLPKVVLIGDSIRMGYAPIVAERLKGVAEVISDPENGGDSQNVLKSLDAWAVSVRPAVIHFNVGLHDLKTDPKTGDRQVNLEQYRANLQRILERLERETSARLIFATTTPVLDARHKAVKPFLRREADVEAYNRVALDVLKRSSSVTVNDLHALAVRVGPESSLSADGVHFTPAAYRALADQVVAEVKKALDEPPVTRAASCRWTDHAPVIDGKLDDPAWANAEVIEHFPAYWIRKETGPGTRARLLWDNDALYFAATMTDKELRAFGTKHNDKLWFGDVFEIFLKPSRERPEYYEFQVNPRSTLLELAFPERGFAFSALASRPPLGMEAVAKVEGTLDHPGDLDKGWSVEGKIPWTVFAPAGGRPKQGSAWWFALCRYDYGPEGTQPVLMSSAPLTRGSFHRYEDYGRLQFEGPKR